MAAAHLSLGRPKRIRFGAAPVDPLGMEDAAARIFGQIESRRGLPHPEPVQVMGPNAFLVTLAAKNTAFAKALMSADFCLPDGMSVVWGGRFLGFSVPERVPGGELMERLCAMAAERGSSVYLLGGLPGAASGAARTLCARFPGLRVVGTDCPEPGFHEDHDRNEIVRARIAAAKPDLLFVALGAPKQEIWMLDECPTLPVGAAMSVGAAFDTLAGLRKRAPAWTHNIGLEWAYRLAMEPRRLWKRYLVGNSEFLGITLREWLRLRRAMAERQQLRQPEPPPAQANASSARDADAGGMLPEPGQRPPSRSEQIG